MKCSSVCPHLQWLISIFWNFGYFKVNQLNFTCLRIVQYIVRFKISMANSMLMKIKDPRYNAFNYWTYSWLVYFFMTINIWPQVFVWTILTYHFNPPQFLIYKKIISFNNVLMVYSFLYHKMPLVAPYNLSVVGIEFLDDQYLACFYLSAFINSRMTALSNLLKQFKHAIKLTLDVFRFQINEIIKQTNLFWCSFVGPTASFPRNFRLWSL